MNNSITLIIPAYNAQESIKNCINSILNQSYQNFEIIVINDGSSDKTLEILQNFKDKRLKIINQKNSGVSVARNAGLKVANGDFIGFIDSDDFLEKDFLKFMLEAILKSCADIVVCDVLIRNSNKTTHFKDIDANCGLINKNLYLKFLLTNQNTMSCIWNKLYKRQILQNLYFDERLILAEDKLFLIKAILQSEKIFKLEKELYIYDVVYKKFIPKHYKNGCLFYELTKNIFCENFKFDEFKDEIFYTKIYNYMFLLLGKENFDKDSFKLGILDLQKDIKKVTKSPYFASLDKKFQAIFKVIYHLKNLYFIYIFLSILNSKLSKFILKKFI